MDGVAAVGVLRTKRFAVDVIDLSGVVGTPLANKIN